MKRCHVARPCANCPFLINGGIRLRTARVREIHDKGGAFACHKTVVRDDEDEIRSAGRECAGAIIFAYKPYGPGAGQMLRISERLGLVDPSFAEDDYPAVFEDLEDMLATAIDAPKRRSKRA